jgi:carboxylesterase
VSGAVRFSIQNRRQTLATEKMVGEGEAEFFAAGRAPCVVAFHGFGGTAAELRPLLDRIASAGYAVDSALLPGHGSRVEQLQDETFRDWIDAAWERTRASLGKSGRVVLLGFSLGSLLAMQIASERPQGLAGLAVLGNALTLRSLSSAGLGLLDRLGLRIPDVYVVKPRAGDVVDTSAMRGLLSYDRHPLRSALEVYRAGPRVRGVVGRIACPTLILHGRRDRVCSWRNATWLADHVGAKDVSIRLFENSGHVLPCDGERQVVADEVLAFLARMG